MRPVLSHGVRVPVWLFLAMLLAFVLPAGAQPAGKNPVLTVQQYRQRLEDALDQVRRMEKRRPRPLDKVLSKLKGNFTVRRPDGATQEVNSEEWARILDNLEPVPTSAPPKTNPPKPGTKPAPTPVPPPAVYDASRPEVAQVRRALEIRLKALDDWAKPVNGAYFKSVDAQGIITQLEKDRQIRTGPSFWQLKLEEWQRTWDGWLKAIDNWLRSLFPTRTTPRTPNPNWNLDWVEYLFYGVVIALLGVILFFIFRALGTQFGRRNTRQDVIFEGEDAELLLLPPDELRLRAQNFAAEGNFREALRHRYLSLLLVLDSRGVWRYDTRRTNWEHIGGLRRSDSHQGLIGPLSDLTRRFDRVRYGGAECSPDEWQRYEQDATTLESKTGGGVKV